MTEYSIPYGKTHLTFTLPPGRTLDVITPRSVPPAANPGAAVRLALESPLGGVRFEQFRGAKSAVIAINDKTRPVPHDILLPPLLAQLEYLGLPPHAITLIIATGLHPRMDAAEFQSILPVEIIHCYPVVCHDVQNESGLVTLGETSRGTPIRVNRLFVEADLRIVVGDIEPHQFQGFSGGVKSAAIGLAGADTITRNHSWMFDPRARLGEFENNPARQDVEEIGQRIGVHFALNAILNHERQIVDVLAGEPGVVMQAGIPRVRQVCQVDVARRYDLVIASPGGHPKDINLYQSQKALAHAALMTKPGGTVILVASCPEGTGSAHYEAWARQCTSLEEMISRFEKEEFCIGPHKAYQIARDAVRVRLFLLSDMESDFVRSLLLTPVSSIDDALASCLPDLPPAASIAILPHAAATIPALSVL